MGCLIEFLGGLIVDMIAELMCLIIPKKKISEMFRFVLEVLIHIFTVLLIVCIIIGIVMLFNDEEVIKEIGRYMVTIPIVIIIVQIALGIILRIILRRGS